MSTPFRSGLRFKSLDELLADVNQLQTIGWEKSGRWSLAMVADHLAKWTACMLDGGLRRVPGFLQWIPRIVIRRMAVKQFYPSSLPIHAPGAMKPVADISESDALAEFHAAVARLQKLRGPTVYTHLFGRLPLHDFQQMTLLHAAHHLAYLRPAAH